MIKGYTTKEKIENYLLIDIDDSFDDQINEWIEVIEKYIDDFTGLDWGIASEESGYAGEQRVFDGDGTKTISPGFFTEIMEIKLSPTGEALSEDDYYLYPANKTDKNKIKLAYLVFPVGDQNIYITANWGVSEIPLDISFAATVLVAGIINNSWQSEGEIESMTIGRYQVSFKNQEQVNDFKQVQKILEMNKKFDF
jgi:hypothetical protein